jgi:hypothetical protein
MPSATLRVVFLPPETFCLPALSVGAAERPGRHSHAERGNENSKIALCRCYSLQKCQESFPDESFRDAYLSPLMVAGFYFNRLVTLNPAGVSRVIIACKATYTLHHKFDSAHGEMYSWHRSYPYSVQVT